MRKLVAALACRVNGSRLYGKPLQALDLDRGLSIIEYMLDFTKSEPTIEETVIGVGAGAENEPFHRIAAARGLKSITGDETDVLQRLIQCGEAGGGTDVFRITTESPFIYVVAVERIPHRPVRRSCRQSVPARRLDRAAGRRWARACARSRVSPPMWKRPR